MRVGLGAQVLQSQEHSGFGYYANGLYKALLAQKDKDIEIVLLESKWARDLSTLERFYHDRFELPKVGEEKDVDIIHQPVFSCPKSSKKVIWTLHDLRPLIVNEPMSLPASMYWKKWLPYSARYATQIVYTSQNSRHDGVKYLGLSSELPIIPVGIPQEVVDWHKDNENKKKNLQKFALHQPYFSTLGTIQPIKNYPFLLDVFARLRQEFNLQHQLVIIGKKGWDYDAVKQKLVEHKFEEGKEVIITGYVSDDEKWSLMQDSEAFLFPSLYEGFGIPPLEAQALGVPLISANNSSLPEVVGDGGVLASATEVDSWLVAYNELQDKKQAIVKAGKKNIERFFWDKIAKEWLDLYRTTV